MADPVTYEGRGDDIQDALKKAHMQIPLSPGKDFTISKVLTWGMQFGGFTQATTFYVVVEEDKTSPFKTD
jgi:hypothetical protein